jgi:predicted patatin/cPLA2 family phospholipase
MKYTVLGLNGGGMRGSLQVGALQELADQEGEQYLSSVFTDGVYGISIGALIATLIAFEFSVDELNLLTELLGNMQDAFNPLRLQSLLSLTQTNGIDDGSKIYTLLDREFKKRSLDFSTLRIGDAAIPLHIIASDLTTLKITIFGQSIRVWDALRASFSLPYIFTPHEIQEHLFVDGALLCQKIMDVIPAKKRPHTLLLLTTQEPRITLDNYLGMVPFCKAIKETYGTKAEYSDNTCLLVEDGAQMVSFWNSDDVVRHLIGIGRTAYREFRTDRLHKKLA